MKNKRAIHKSKKSLLVAKRGGEDQINRIRNERASETVHQVEKLAA